MHGHDIIVVGASAGGLPALTDMLGPLPPDLAASILVVQHLSPTFESRLNRVLRGRTRMAVDFAGDEERLEHGHIYLAPADHHMLVRENCVRLSRSAPENTMRPSIDVLFRSAAVAYGPRVIGIVLSGTLDDGAAGLAAIKECGGVAIVQDPFEAAFREMPESALAATDVDHCVSTRDMAPLLIELIHRTSRDAEAFPAPERVKTENAFALIQAGMSDGSALADAAGLTCPSCHGSLWEMVDGDCSGCGTEDGRSVLALAVERGRALEQAMFRAVRALQETAHVARRLSQNSSSAGRKASQEEKAQQMDDAADTLRLHLIRAARSETPAPA